MHWTKLPNREEIIERIRLKKTGVSQSEETKQKRSKSLKKAYAEGRKTGFTSEFAIAHNKSKEQRLAVSKAKKGVPQLSMRGDNNPSKRLEVRLKISKSKKELVASGKHNLWKGGVYPQNLAERQTFEYKQWRRSVYERDDYTCQLCGERGGRLEADHIKRFALYPELRLDVNNGRTLCVDCHRGTDTWGRLPIPVIT